jgi:soluble lytic murein transglycosylase-like protein
MNKVRILSVIALISAVMLIPVGTNTTRPKLQVETSASLPFMMSKQKTKDGGNKNETEHKQTQQLVTQKERRSIKIKEYWKIPLSHDLQDYIRKLCKKYGVSEQLAYGVIRVESNFNPNKISETNDYGLFQINVINRGWLGRKFNITNWFDPYQNAKAGVYMLGMLMKKYHDTNTVLMAYNLGEGGMRYLHSRGIWSTNYSRKVIDAMENFRKQFVIVHLQAKENPL